MGTTPQPDSSRETFLRWRSGEIDAVDELTPTLYSELRGLARHYMRGERAGHTLQPTDLVNEAYLRLVGGRGKAGDRSHFVALAAKTMRRVLIDHARRKQAAKRGGDEEPVTLEPGVMAEAGGLADRPLEILALDEALVDLSRVNRRAAQVVELRFFGGLSCPEVAEVMDLSVTTIERDWRAARAWLRRELDGE